MIEARQDCLEVSPASNSRHSDVELTHDANDLGSAVREDPVCASKMCKDIPSPPYLPSCFLRDRSVAEDVKLQVVPISVMGRRIQP